MSRSFLSEVTPGADLEKRKKRHPGVQKRQCLVGSLHFRDELL